MDMHSAEFGAAAELREHLSGVEKTFGIESAFEALLLIEIALIEHRVHEIALLHADPMFARQDAADLDAETKDVGAKRLGLVELARLVRVIEDQRMEISIAGMKDVRHAQAVSRLHLLHALQHGADLLARNRPVHAVVVGRDPADGGKRSLPPGPEQQPLLLGLAGAAACGAMPRGDRLHRGDEM